MKSRELYEQMAAYIDTKAEWMKNNRQDLHKHAESAWHEVRTCTLIVDYLKKLGVTDIKMGRECFIADERMGLPPQEELDAVYERALEQGAIPEYAPYFKDGFTGVEATIDTGKPGPVIGYRVDIDALGVIECQDPAVHRPAREGFASINEGEMHACGHDCHATIGMATADAFMHFKDQLCGKLKIVFQPGEEGVRGARGMVNTGWFDDIDYMMAIHMRPETKDHPEQRIHIENKNCMANCKMDVYVTGKACHAASPQNGNNAMLATAAIIQGVYGIPRASVGDARINVGQVIAGTGRNVVCDRSKIVMEIRGLTQESLEYLRPYTERIIEHAAAMHGCTAEIKIMGATPCVPTDTPEFSKYLADLANEVGLGCNEPGAFVSTSDDYAYMAQKVMEHGGVSCYMNLCSPFSAPGHAVTYDIEEKDLPNGVKMYAAAAISLMDDWKEKNQ
ncbi:MAG: amidohydrolase [Firmicutes bacterium]|nr:amidohydrolase [Bacillota bacterium]